MLNTIENLRFYHAANKSIALATLGAAEDSAVVWETCLRKIYFFDSLESLSADPITPSFVSEKEQALRLYEGGEALEFLLSVLCGLDSKVIGETEIFGQFKNFAQSPEAQNLAFFRDQKAVQFLFQEVKAIRDAHLKGLGVHSYGSLIRKMSKDLDRVSIIGYGNLSQEVIPWFKNKHIEIHVRSPEKYSDQGNLQFYKLGSAELSSLVVIAAPITNTELQKIFSAQSLSASQGSKITQIIDCRSLNHEQTSLVGSGDYEVVELKDLFDLLAGQQQKIQEALPRIRSEIKQRVEEHLLRSHHRPLGWDDLC